MVWMNFIFIFISSSDTNLLRKKSVKQKIKKRCPNILSLSIQLIQDGLVCFFSIHNCKVHVSIITALHHENKQKIVSVTTCLVSKE